MGWRHNRYKARPSSKNRAACIAWDLFAVEAQESNSTISLMWYDDSMRGEEYWSAEFDDGAYSDIDALVVLDRKNNPHKYVEQIQLNAERRAVMPVQFTTTKEEAKLIGKIVERAKDVACRANGFHDFDGVSLHMDLSACIAQGCPLRLKDLLAADEFNFAHDVFGIRRHINRQTGKLEDHFLPRFHA